MSGAGSHQNASARSRRKGGEGERSGRSEGERRGSKESGEGGRDEDRGRWRGREDRLIEDKRQDGRRDAGGLSGQMNRNREVSNVDHNCSIVYLLMQKVCIIHYHSVMQCVMYILVTHYLHFLFVCVCVCVFDRP